MAAFLARWTGWSAFSQSSPSSTQAAVTSTVSTQPALQVLTKNPTTDENVAPQQPVSRKGQVDTVLLPAAQPCASRSVVSTADPTSTNQLQQQHHQRLLNSRRISNDGLLTTHAQPHHT